MKATTKLLMALTMFLALPLLAASSAQAAQALSREQFLAQLSTATESGAPATDAAVEPSGDLLLGCVCSVGVDSQGNSCGCSASGAGLSCTSEGEGTKKTCTCKDATGSVTCKLVDGHCRCA